jgi:hypothetical protein
MPLVWNDKRLKRSGAAARSVLMGGLCLASKR